METKIIIKLHNMCQQEHYELRKNIGLLDPKGMYQLIDTLSLNANPRLAKSGRVIDEIMYTLEETPDLFMYKSKGILLSSSKCEELDRSRLRLTFENESLEGILDGGHNTLAIAKYFVKCVAPEKEKRIKLWDDLKDIWDNEKDNILSEIESNNSQINYFLTPVEIISPVSENSNFYNESIFDISSARNNNAELTATAKANYAGYYDKLAEKLDPEIEKEIEWKTNEPNKRIKAQDIVSLSLIPIIFLQKEGKLPSNIPTINPISLYSSKAKCVNDFTTIMTNKTIGLDDNNGNIKSSLLDSALDLMEDIPRIYDYIYENFPDAYNYSSSRFGGISCVKMYADKVESDKHLHRKPRTKFYNNEVFYKYPDGFIYPIVVGMSSLMQIRDNRVEWKVDPFAFLENNLHSIIEMYVSLIKTLGYNPQYVGKDSSTYQVIEMSINMNLILNK